MNGLLAAALKSTNNRFVDKKTSRIVCEEAQRDASLHRLSDRTPKIGRSALAPEALSATIHELVRN